MNGENRPLSGISSSPLHISRLAFISLMVDTCRMIQKNDKWRDVRKREDTFTMSPRREGERRKRAKEQRGKGMRSSHKEEMMVNLGSEEMMVMRSVQGEFKSCLRGKETVHEEGKEMGSVVFGQIGKI